MLLHTVKPMMAAADAAAVPYIYTLALANVKCYSPSVIPHRECYHKYYIVFSSPVLRV